TFSVHLTPGIYTVSKVLTINKDARDYYLAQYIDSTSGANHCIRTLDSFVQEALAGIDTSACYVTCNDCVAALGTKDDFVSSGQGTELQWEILLEQCTEPCKDKTLCETGYEMMLLDVTLGGQYAKYDAVAGTSTDPTSVLNESNYLNSNFMSSGVSNWRHPKIILGGTIHEQYLDDNGVRKKVNVFSASTANGWSPEVYDTTKIYTTPVTGEKYVYPENLEHLSDFISSWEPYFARSLVMYHPEFVYYIACKDYSTKFAGDARSADQFDSLMMASSTFDEAVTNGFINPSYMSISDPNSRLTNWASSGAHAYDPFFSNASAFNNFTGPFQTSYPTSPSYNHSTTATALYNNLVSFFTIPPSSSYTFIKTAAMFARCGNIFATGTPDTSCTNFGRDYFPNPFSDLDIEDMNDSIRNSEWTHLKHFYISEKRKKQYFRMHYLARFMDVSSNPAMPSHDILGGCNTCIGDPTFTPFLYGFYSFPGSTSDVAFDLSQPCSFMTWHLFYNKQKRFVDLANTGLSGINVPYQVYQQTGQTPMAFQLQNFLNDMAQGHYLYPSSNIGLSGISTFNLEMYKAVNGGTLPVSFINYNWVVDSTISTTLYASIVDTALSSIACQFTLDISGTPIIDFTKIKNVQSLS
ncbi:MAG: hypothetical protein JNL69_03445, partial [Bacteroidia bacterium]|nr:hypothetical protein [Bacteroidia bacterium]